MRASTGAGRPVSPSSAGVRRLLLAALVCVQATGLACTQNVQTRANRTDAPGPLNSTAAPGVWLGANNQELAQNATQGANLTEALNEILVRQSNLQVEESHQAGPLSVALPPPAPPNRPSEPPVSFSGGSGNSYMSMSRDGSNRYQFGFDTQRGRSAGAGAPGRANASRPAPRLMREESRLEDGTVIGRYGYTDPFNVFRIVQYVAGPDGYFATEDVGALGDQQQSEPGRLQLNRQLHKALEQARANRLRRAGAANSNAERPVSSRPQSSSEHPSGAESLHGSASHQSVRFATRINHVVGNNGVTYATAFRPVVRQQPAWGFQQQQSGASPLYASSRMVQSTISYQPVPASPVGPARQSARPANLEQQAALRRSQVPAPIYSPEIGEQLYHFYVEHDTSVSPPEAGEQPDGAQEQPSYVGSASSTSNNNDQRRAANVLQSSPAWTLLNNNYNGNFQSAVVIDHTNHGQPAASANLNGLNEQMSASFKREAALLAQVRRRQQQASWHGDGDRPAPPRAVAGSLLVAPTFDLTKFGARTSSVATSPPPPPAVGASYEFALKHFDWPLYRPEVHETRPDEAQVELVGDRVAAALPPHAPADQSSDSVDVLWRSGSEVSSSTPSGNGSSVADSRQANATSKTQNSAASDAPMIVDSSTRDLTRAASPVVSQDVGRELAATPVAARVASEQNSLSKRDLGPLAHPADGRTLAYATRLSGARLASNSDDELHMEDSEQVAAYSANNATGAGLSRARLPNRQKKLSSIFKPRTASAASGPNADETNQSGGQRIRRPVPADVRRQLQQAAYSRQTSSTTTTTESPAIRVGQEAHESAPSDSGGRQNLTSSEAPVETRPSSVPQPAKSATASKKFGANSVRQVDDLQQLDETPEPVSAKNRPVLRQEQQQSSRKTAVRVGDKGAADASSPVMAPNANQVDQNRENIARVSEKSGEKLTDSKVGEPTRTVVIDATQNQQIIQSSDGQRPALHRDLLDKIMRIQKEIASRSASLALAPVSSTSTTSTTEQPTTSSSPTTTTSSPTTTTSSPTTTTSSPTTTTSTTTSTTATPLSTTSSSAATTQTDATTTNATTTPPSTTTNEPVAISRSSTQAPITTNSPIQVSPTPSIPTRANSNEHDPQLERNFLTGPLIRMSDNADDPDDLMTRLAREFTLFDSARAPIAPPETTTLSSAGGRDGLASLVVVATLASVEPVTASSVELPAKPAVGEYLPGDPAVRPQEKRDPASMTTTTSTSTPIVTTSPAPTEATTSLIAWETTPRGSYLSLSRQSWTTNATEAPTQTPTPTSTSTSTSTTITPLPPVPSAPQTTTTTAAPLTTSTSTSTSTSTTTTTAGPTNSSSTRRPTGAQRIGRLVIKRGDKVVARFNASDSIPDSMIPVGGNGSEIIMPDLPRMGMRRAKKKKLVQTEGDSANSTAPQSSQVATVTNSTLASKRHLFRRGRSYLTAADNSSAIGSSASSASVTNSTVESASQPKEGELAAGSKETKWPASKLLELARQDAERALNKSKKYDPNEDLKKLVEKINLIERKAAQLGA